ncbi:hypothetical protein L1889_03690 [Paenalcaligenes niemegkensis]|uniref:hypothetical protein n=1 Tax=Paenalcaligenes niemegkensis TaxID=2895469 RepID=UPI001EE95954|nr:hypothetical protein [Paenalcaligenes niemegkensis]MCQ9615912.1 hypothetical protein [Paenalcaligenes niemegkensis]
MSTNQQPTLSAVDIESRAWQLNELFRVIDETYPGITDGGISISTIALLGSDLATELAEYAGDQRPNILGMASPPPAVPTKANPEDMGASYQKTIEAVELLAQRILTADLDLLAVAEKRAIEDALKALTIHTDGAAHGFFGGVL